MATTIKTRILNRIDLYENWVNNNPTPMEGEMCIVVVPAETGAIPQEPATLVKVGDGKTAFLDLPFLTAVAGDVHDWAKAPNKPVYEAAEITGIDTFIAEYVSSEMGIEVDTDTQYTMIPVEGNAYQYKLMSKSKADSEYTKAVAVIDIPKYDDAALISRVGALETLVGNEAVAAQIAAQIAALDLANTYETKGAAAEVQTKLDAEITRAAAAEAALIDRLAPIETFMEAAELDTDDNNVIDTLKEIQTYIKSDKTGAANMLASINQNAAAIEAASGVLENHGKLLDSIEEGAQVNKIDGVSEEFAISDKKILSISSVSQAKVSGLIEALAGKVSVEAGKSLVDDELIAKLQAMKADGEANVLNGIKIAGVEVEIDSDKKANIAVATAAKAGVVKGADALNGVTVAADGSMSVHSLSISKLVQEETEMLILSGGSSKEV